MNGLSSYFIVPRSAESRLLWCLKDARALLSNPDLGGQGDEGPGWCPVRAVARSAVTAKVRFTFLLKLRLVLRLRAAVPASHRSWWPECTIRYNADPTVTHADIMAWLNRAIEAAAEPGRSDRKRQPVSQAMLRRRWQRTGRARGQPATLGTPRHRSKNKAELLSLNLLPRPLPN
jgi:hypothetical protein